MQEIGNSIHPFTTNTLPYVIAALRVLANKLEEKTNGEWERTIKGAEKLMNTIDVIQKEEEVLDVEQAEIAKMTQETLHESTKVTKEEKRDE